MYERTFSYTRLSMERFEDGLNLLAGSGIIVFTLTALFAQPFQPVCGLVALLLIAGGAYFICNGVSTPYPDLRITPDGLLVKVRWQWMPLPWNDFYVRRNGIGFSVVTTRFTQILLRRAAHEALGDDKGFVIGNNLEGLDDIELAFVEHRRFDAPPKVVMFY
jgi:hypothetical protein